MRYSTVSCTIPTILTSEGSHSGSASLRTYERVVSLGADLLETYWSIYVPRLVKKRAAHMMAAASYGGQNFDCQAFEIVVCNHLEAKEIMRGAGDV